jgi:uncharacterized protein YejL (UPF0352 family)
MGREWTNNDLIEYMSRYSDRSPVPGKDSPRQAVLNQVTTNDLLAEFLGTTNGRLILGSVVDSITADVMNIVGLAVSGGKTDEVIQQIVGSAQRINVAEKFMRGLATIASTGKQHITEMKKQR